jgi:hypothetical protein
MPQPLAVLGVVWCRPPGGHVRNGPSRRALVLSLPLPDRIPYQPLVISLGAAALVMAALALIPRRQVQIATNVLVAIGTVFLAI